MSINSHSRKRWAYINRDKDIDKQSDLKPSQRSNPKRKTKIKGTKTRDQINDDTKETLKDKDLKRET